MNGRSLGDRDSIESAGVRQDQIFGEMDPCFCEMVASSDVGEQRAGVGLDRELLSAD